MKSLFIESGPSVERYTQAGLELDRETQLACEEIVVKYVTLGYSIRDIDNIMKEVINMLTCSAILDLSREGEKPLAWLHPPE